MSDPRTKTDWCDWKTNTNFGTRMKMMNLCNMGRVKIQEIHIFSSELDTSFYNHLPLNPCLRSWYIIRHAYTIPLSVFLSLPLSLPLAYPRVQTRVTGTGKSHLDIIIQGTLLTSANFLFRLQQWVWWQWLCATWVMRLERWRHVNGDTWWVDIKTWDLAISVSANFHLIVPNLQ